MIICAVELHVVSYTKQQIGGFTMKTLTRIKAFILAMIMTMGTFSTTAFAAEIRDDSTVVKGDIVSSEVLSDGMVATTVEYQIADSSEDAILEVPTSTIMPRIWDTATLYDFGSGYYDGNGHKFSSGNYLGFELTVTSRSGYNKDQAVTASLRTGLGFSNLGEAIGHTINTSQNTKADWISIDNSKTYYWRFTSNDVSSTNSVNVVVTYYTWN